MLPETTASNKVVDRSRNRNANVIDRSATENKQNQRNKAFLQFIHST